MSRIESHVRDEIASATRHLERAHQLSRCHYCKTDIGLVLEATKDLETIAAWAESLEEHPHRLRAIRNLAAQLDRLHAFSMLVMLTRNSFIRKLLLLGSR